MDGVEFLRGEIAKLGEPVKYGGTSLDRDLLKLHGRSLPSTSDVREEVV